MKHLIPLTLVFLACSTVEIINWKTSFTEDSLAKSGLTICYVQGDWEGAKGSKSFRRDKISGESIPELFYEELINQRTDINIVSPRKIKQEDSELYRKLYPYRKKINERNTTDSLDIADITKDIKTRYLLYFEDISIGQTDHQYATAGTKVMMTGPVQGKSRSLILLIQIWDLETCRVVYRAESVGASGSQYWKGNFEKAARRASRDLIKKLPR